MSPSPTGRTPPTSRGCHGRPVPGPGSGTPRHPRLGLQEGVQQPQQAQRRAQEGPGRNGARLGGHRRGWSSDRRGPQTAHDRTREQHQPGQRQFQEQDQVETVQARRPRLAKVGTLRQPAVTGDSKTSGIGNGTIPISGASAGSASAVSSCQGREITRVRPGAGSRHWSRCQLPAVWMTGWERPRPGSGSTNARCWSSGRPPRRAP